jgi:hypothetical protein
VCTGWQAIAACLRIPAPFFQENGAKRQEMGRKVEKSSSKYGHFFEKAPH